MTETLLIFALFLVVVAIIVGFVFFLRWLDNRRLNRPRRVRYKPIIRHEYDIDFNEATMAYTVWCKSCEWTEVVRSRAGAELEGELHAPTG
jgi:hypothetical protein